MSKTPSNKPSTTSHSRDTYLIHSLVGNTSGSNTSDSIMSIINQKPATSSTQTSNQTQKERK